MIAQKLKDDFLIMKNGFQIFLQNYNKQKEAERNNKLIVIPTQQHITLEMKPIQKLNPQLNTGHVEQDSSSQLSNRLMSTQFAKFKTSTPASVIGSSRIDAIQGSVINSAGYNDFRNCL